MDYLIGICGLQSGPFSETEVREKIARNAYPPGTLCWTDGWPQWRSLESVFAGSGVAPPALPSEHPPSRNTYYNNFRPDHMQPEVAGLAIASLILGVAGLVMFFPAIPAIVCGHLACSEINKSEGRKSGRGVAITGLIIGYFVIALLPITFAAIAIPAFSKVSFTSSERVSSYRISISPEKAVLSNLREFEAAARQYMLEKGVTRATYADLTNPDRDYYLRALNPAAGENYTDLVINSDDTEVKVTLADGRIIVLERFTTSDNSTSTR